MGKWISDFPYSNWYRSSGSYSEGFAEYCNPNNLLQGGPGLNYLSISDDWSGIIMGFFRGIAETKVTLEEINLKYY